MGHIIGLAVILLLFGAVLLIRKVTGGTIFPFAMMALAEDYNNPEVEGRIFLYPVLTGVLIYEGAIVVLDSSGYAKPGVTGTGLIAVGRSEEQIDNTNGQSGDLYVKVKRGVFRYANSLAADLITIAQVGDACYIVDDFTVAKTSGTNTRSVAGEIANVDADGVWLEIPSARVSINGDLVSTNNLSDINSATTARSNIGANLVALTLNIADLTTGHTYYVASPVAGHITKLQAILNAALGTANATLTGNIGTTPITTGAFTLLYSGSAAGDYFALTPSGANTVAVGSKINFVVTGSQALQVGCTVTILITTDV